MNTKPLEWWASHSFGGFRALLLCQHWSLFSYVVPFNYTMEFEVELRDGRVMTVHDLTTARAGKWRPVLFHNERKTQLNLYGNPPAMRHYLDYLIRCNGIDLNRVARRTIYVRYRNVLSRNEATRTGTHYSPEARYVFDSY